MKKLTLTICGVLSMVAVLAQDAATAEKTFWDDPINHPLMPLYLVSALVLIVVVLVIVVAAYLLRVLNLLVAQAAREKAARLGIAYTPEPSWWSKLWQKMNASVPVAQEKDIEMDHTYDGIRELDNHLPPWWKWLFYATIAWAAIYVVIYHFANTLPLSAEEYEQEIALADEQKEKLKASQPAAVIDENALVYTADAAILEKGKAVFNNNSCTSCHRSDGGGNTIGPNLTDAYWLHGGDIKDIFKTIKDGVVEKGMPAWGKAMSPQDVRDVAFFVMSLQGTNPPDAKAPQGERIESSTQPKADSIQTQASL